MNKVSALLYVHVPFCVHKCGYCDFNSWGETRREPQELWAHALRKQIDFWSSQIQDRQIEFSSVFFSNETPSLLADDLLASTVVALKRSFKFAPQAEWSLECNPETVTQQKLSSLCDLGFNRISVGIQSFQDHHLERLERHARRGDNLRTLELIAQHWKGRWSGDLMFGLPNQTLADWELELEELLQFRPTHSSCYQLTLTTARSQNWSQASEDELLEFFNLTESRLAQSGLARYEVSNFSLPGHESQHNLGYWRMTPFLGLGPGAAGVLSPRFLAMGDVGDQVNTGFESNSLQNTPSNWDPLFGAHQKNADRFETWLAASGTPLYELSSSLKPRPGRDHLFEMLMMGLRVSEGIDMNRIEQILKPAARLEIPAQISDFIVLKGDRLKVTHAGLRILDHLLPKLYRHLEKIADPNLDSISFDPKFY